MEECDHSMCGHPLVPFPQRLHRAAGRGRDGAVLSWSEDGTRLLVDDGHFPQKVLAQCPGLVKSTRLLSFKRRLNSHGFRMVARRKASSGHTVTEYAHPDFQRDKPELLSNVQCHDRLSRRQKTCNSAKERASPDTLYLVQQVNSVQKKVQAANGSHRGGHRGKAKGSNHSSATDLFLSEQRPIEIVTGNRPPPGAAVAPDMFAPYLCGSQRPVQQSGRGVVMVPFLEGSEGYIPLVPHPNMVIRPRIAASASSAEDGECGDETDSSYEHEFPNHLSPGQPTAGPLDTEALQRATPCEPHPPCSPSLALSELEVQIECAEVEVPSGGCGDDEVDDDAASAHSLASQGTMLAMLSNVYDFNDLQAC